MTSPSEKGGTHKENAHLYGEKYVIDPERVLRIRSGGAWYEVGSNPRWGQLATKETARPFLCFMWEERGSGGVQEILILANHIEAYEMRK